jgi:hypothetical protein
MVQSKCPDCKGKLVPLLGSPRVCCRHECQMSCDRASALALQGL